jgi:hypothetical protein
MAQKRKHPGEAKDAPPGQQKASKRGNVHRHTEAMKRGRRGTFP